MRRGEEQDTRYDCGSTGGKLGSEPDPTQGRCAARKSIDRGTGQRNRTRVAIAARLGATWSASPTQREGDVPRGTQSTHYAARNERKMGGEQPRSLEDMN